MAARAGVAHLSIVLAAAFALTAVVPGAAAQATPPAAVSCELQQGPLRLAAEALETALRQAEGPQAQARAAAALAQAHLRMNRLDSAERLLLQARAGLTLPRERAAAALDLGQVHLARGGFEPAEAAWRAALADAPQERDVALAVELNLLRLPGAEQRLQRLQAASAQLGAIAGVGERARHALNIAAQAGEMGVEGQGLALQMFEAGRALASAAGEHALAAEAYDGLGALHERQQRDDEALRLTERGLWHAQHLPARELAVPLEWRAARLAQRAGRGELALAAYRRAVEHVEAVRTDIPVTYFDGRSSFRETLAPVYLGLTEQLLRQSDGATGPARQALLRQARDTVELIKQTELEDYLRDRCTVGAARREQPDEPFVPPPATAIYYPIILPGRLELLLETAQGIERFTVDVAGDVLRRAALDFVDALRGRRPYQAGAERLYRWLVAPIEPALAAGGVRTLVAVPDGVLRLVPLAALHDGRDFLVKRLRVATVPGLSMTAAPRRDAAPPRALLAGMSEPGPVLARLPLQMVEMVVGAPVPPAAGAREPSRSMLRGGAVHAAAPAGALPLPTPPTLPAAGATAAEREAERAGERDKARTLALKEALALPGVKQELAQIAGVLGHTSLLDQAFTLAAFEQQLLGQDFEVVHIASHGVFGDSADTTFIMTYDELLTLDGLQRLLSHERFRKRPIGFITLSACQTAEGDDRAPLGMSGTALKARARSALGTLWPVADEAAQRLMSQFYRLLAVGRLGKAEALREAQIGLIENPAFQHPFFWAPFTLIGEWQ